ncbi:oligoendopeptidase F [Pilibacter termitis]|uniref:Oligopeptidase F n=1 Tax=Pilibacter termitis TaxID=263852 RepID=A0A1T4NP12_9ENTE|nr:oligoendopeptidase F [Pilibacter termitis]SJZ81060.1 oligoendopeptidase F [Pilibacter termitis]
MSEIKKLPKREEVAVKDTWDLTKVFATDEEWEKAFEELTKLIEQSATFQGTLEKGADALVLAIHHMEVVNRKLETLYCYASMKSDEDTTNSKYQSMSSRAGSIFANAQESLAWFEPEILSIPDEVLQDFFAENEELAFYKHFIEQITGKREHILPAEQEGLLAGVAEIFSGAGETFSILNNADLQFPVVKNDEGEDVQLSHGVFGQLLESRNREVRKSAFEGMYQVYDQFQHTLASTLSFNVKGDNTQAKIRHYSSAREKALSQNHVPESVYDTLVEVVNEHLPLLHRYVALRKKAMKVEELHTYDLYTPLIEDDSLKYTYEQAKEKALLALAPLGEEYLSHVKEAFDDRWIDVVENQGKRSGAYSGGSYDMSPYILMNWHDSLDQLYTLVHEMGHSIHSYFTRNNQPFIYGDYSIFLAEIASTTNENILTEHLLATEKDPKVRAYILNHYLDGFKGTVFRQTQFAEFEHFIHTQDAAGNPLTSDMLNEYYGDLNARYYGEHLTKDAQIALEWARIPHFYYNYYVFQYSTGFAAASALSQKIVHGTEKELNQYLDYLKAGSSDYPIEVMKRAGVDMTRKDYLVEAFKVFEQRLNELEEILEEID